MKVFIKPQLDKIKNPIFIYGLGGGMGNIAKIVAGQLIKKFDAKRVASIVTDGISDVVIANKKGILSHISIDLYHFKHRRKNFLVMYGITQPNIQPQDITERYKIVLWTLGKLHSLNTKEIISIGGYGVDIEPEDPKLYIAANNKKFLDIILKKSKKLSEGKEHNVFIYKKSNIVGMSGLFVSLSRYYNINSAILLAETYPTPNINGYYGSAKILDFLNILYSFNIDTSSLRQKGEKVRNNVLKRLMVGKTSRKDREERREIYYFG